MLPLVFLAMAIVGINQQRYAFGQQSIERRKEFLRRLIPLLALERDEDRSDPRIWMEHQSWKEWQETTGELPPDFATMPANADLPDPLVMELTFRTSGSGIFPFSTRDFRSLSSVSLRPIVEEYVGSFCSVFRSLIETIDLNASIYETALM